MRRLVYSMMVSLDGYIADPSGSIDWVRIDEEIHTFVNDISREAGAFLYGRRMWETMAAFWPTGDTAPDSTPAMIDYARIWQATPKYVYSTSLEATDGATLVSTGADKHVAALKQAAGGHLEVSGAGLAAAMLRLGLVDEIRPFVNPPSFSAAAGRCSRPTLIASTCGSSRCDRSRRASPTSATRL